MNGFHRLVGLAACIALFVYALSCRPAWSPDSRVVAFTYIEGEESGGVAVHNVLTQKTEKVIAFAKEMNITFPQVFWMGDKLAVLGRSDEDKGKETGDRLLLLAINPATRALHGVQTFDIGTYDPSPTAQPVVDREGGIWIGGMEKGKNKHGLLRLKVDAGTVEGVGDSETVVLDKGGDLIFYSRDLEKDAIEVGIFDPAQNQFKPLVDIPGSGELHPSMAASPDGTKTCVHIIKDGRRRVVFVQRSVQGDETSPRAVDLPDNIQEAGGLAFSADSRTCWTVYLPRGEEDSPPSPVLAEIDPEKGLLRKINLPFHEIRIDDELTFALQPIISPNGRWLALATATFEKDSRGRLLLVDLHSETLRVKAIDPP